MGKPCEFYKTFTLFACQAKNISPRGNELGVEGETLDLANGTRVEPNHGCELPNGESSFVQKGIEVIPKRFLRERWHPVIV